MSAVKKKRVIKRHAGMFKPGQSGNPKGKTPGYQDFAVRARYLIEEYTAIQIIEIVKDQKKWNIPARDIMIMIQIVDGFQRDGGAKAERLLDRILGKPTETHNVNQNVNGAVEHFSVQEIEQWVRDLAGPGEEEENSKTSLPH